MVGGSSETTYSSKNNSYDNLMLQGAVLYSSLCKSFLSCCGAFPAVDLLEKMLVLDTDKRITAAEALAHAYFAQYHDPDDEPVADPYDQSFESRELEIEEWKSEWEDRRGARFPGELWELRHKRNS